MSGNDAGLTNKKKFCGLVKAVFKPIQKMNEQTIQTIFYTAITIAYAPLVAIAIYTIAKTLKEGDDQ